MVVGRVAIFGEVEVDSDPVIGQQSVPVFDNDTTQGLHQRIHTAERELYPRCVAAIAEDWVSLKGRWAVRTKKKGLG